MQNHSGGGFVAVDVSPSLPLREWFLWKSILVRNKSSLLDRATTASAECKVSAPGQDSAQILEALYRAGEGLGVEDGVGGSLWV